MNIKEKLQELIPEKLWGDKKLLLIAGVCVLGVLLIALSAIPSKSEKIPDAPAPPQLSHSDVGEYVAQLEARLAALISEIDGAGKTRVMVTLENSAEEVYAGDEQNKITESQQSTSAENRFEYITIKARDGSEQALLLTVVQPRVRGVAVVCEGGGSALVHTAILQMVTAVLDVSSARVSVQRGR
ncbi:MAG: stage III sporulation protein AG [Oscillospiraceae bacterium]|nr:stage III sporulation protein AG [Oscillospiraceae bacterium]